ERLGCDVEVVDAGGQAVSAVSDRSFDIILMDCQMPGVDGFEATRMIRALPKAASQTPIIALTASGFHDDEQRCLRAGMDDYLAKPIGSRVLANKLSAHWFADSKLSKVAEEKKR
ncbi:MAG: response regulator, partial [Myxococcota bacterium]